MPSATALNADPLEASLPEATGRTSRRSGGRLTVSARADARERLRRACGFASVVVAAASLAVIAPPASEPAAAQLVPLDASCSELNAMVGRPTSTYIVRQGIQFRSDSQARVGPGSDNRYSDGETVRIQVKLSLNADWDVRDDLDPNAEPLAMDFMLGTTAKKANVTPAEGEDSNLLTFEYTLDSTDGSHSANDIWIPENSVRANEFALAFGRGNTINTAGNGAAHQAIHGPCGGAQLEHPAVFHPRTAGSPTIIRRPKIISEPLDGDTYYEGEKIWVQVEYSEPVRVSGTPMLKLRFGSDAEPNPTYKNARYVSPHTSNQASLPLPPDDPRRRSTVTRLLFEYVVQSSDADVDGISIDWGQLSGGSITATDDGTTATLRHDGLAARSEAEARLGGDPTFAEHRVDGSRGPKAPHELWDTPNPAHVLSYSTRVVSEPARGTTLHEGEYIVVRAEFSESIVVEDTRLELPIHLFPCYTADFSHRSRLSGDALAAYEAALASVGCLKNTGTEMNPVYTEVKPTDEPEKFVRYAKYLSGSGHTRLLFYYEIGPNDKDRDGLVVPDGDFTYDGGKEITSTVQDSIITADDDGTLYTHY